MEGGCPIPDRYTVAVGVKNLVYSWRSVSGVRVVRKDHMASRVSEFADAIFEEVDDNFLLRDGDSGVFVVFVGR